MGSFAPRTEVAIVGGGFAGAATGYYLARAGVDVVVLERETVAGRHASGRNAALGRQLADDDALTELALRGAALLRHPPDGLGDALLRPTGSLLLADQPARLAALAAAAVRHDLAHRALDAAEVDRRWPRLIGGPHVGAIEVPDDGVIDVRRLLDGLLRGVARARGRVELGGEVTALAPASGGGVAITTTRGPLAARALVVAGGAWAAEVGRRLGAEPPALTVQRRHLFVTGPVAGVDRDAPFVWLEGERPFYARPDGDGYLLCACDDAEVAPGDAVVQPGAAAALADRLARVAPGLAVLPIASARACLRTFTADGRPLIGWDRRAEAIFWVAALGGHGATTALAVGERAARGVLERIR